MIKIKDGKVCPGGCTGHVRIYRNMEGYVKWVRIYSEIGAAENLMEGWGNDG